MQRCLVPSSVLNRSRSYGEKKLNIFRDIYYFTIIDSCNGLGLFWTKLNFLDLKVLLATIGLKLPSDFGEEEILYII